MKARVLAACLAFAGVLHAAGPGAPSRVAANDPVSAIASAYRAADRAFQEGDYLLARRLTVDLTGRFPTDAALWLRLGQVEQALGMFGPSLAAYDRAIECETAHPVDGGAQMAVIRYHRARLLVTEAGNELAASSALPIEERLEASREALLRALDLARAADPLLPRVTTPTVKAVKRAKGYVVEVPAGGRP